VEKGSIAFFFARLLLHQELGNQDQGLEQQGQSTERR
jgi:hypothetical protein